jgi:membrane protease YdiL (CAAX protease family)
MTPSSWPPPVAAPGQPASRGFSVPLIIGTWAAAWLVGNVVGAALVIASGHGETDPFQMPTWVVSASAAALWVPALVALLLVSRARGTGSWARDFGLRARWVDLVGLPIGVASQLILVPLVTLPFTRLFPDSFSAERVEERAKGLADMASGPWIVLLALVVVVGAPIVEELVYRGFVQLGLARRIGGFAALIVAAAWFTLVHLSPPEFPGLFAFSLVLGLCAARTGRLGTAIAAHVAFNATGLLLVVLL